MRAGRLSVASTLGEDKILTRESVARAFTKIRTFPGPKMPVTPNGNGLMPSVAGAQAIQDPSQDTTPRRQRAIKKCGITGPNFIVETQTFGVS